MQIGTDYQLFIDGCWTAPAQGRYAPCFNPATAAVIAQVPDGTAEDVAAAVAAARAAAPAWDALGWEPRARALHALADVIERHRQELAELDAVNGGIPIDGGLIDVEIGIRTLRYFAGIASELKGHTQQLTPGSIGLTMRESFGVVGRIVPFNHPFQFAAAGIAAPLAAGNAIVLKPADATPLSALRLAELTVDVLPPGLVNVVTGGAEVGDAIVRNPQIPRIAFTGSVSTGRAVAKAAAERLKLVTLELGGKNPMIIGADVDVDEAAQAAVTAMNFQRAQGQSCGSPSRIFVHESIRQQFVERVAAIVADMRIGDPTRTGIQMGPLAFEQHYHRVNHYIRQGIEEGARLVTGGERPADQPTGYFVTPAIFDQVTPDMVIAREEIFGPVMCVFGWTDPDELIETVNALDVGLTAYIFTRDLPLAMRFVRSIESGYIWVNKASGRPLGLPFGGYKQSGIGAENSLDELLSFTRTKSVVLS